MSFRNIRIALSFTAILAFMACSDSDVIIDQNPNTNDPTYTVGGSVTGLNGELILTLNSDENLSVDEDGSFRFNEKLNDEASYQVEVKKAPFDQNCMLTNAAGNIEGSNVHNVSIVCSARTWSVPLITEAISPATPGYFPKIAMDAAGNAIVVWAQFDGTFTHIYKAEYRNNVWTYPADVNDHISVHTAGANYPQVAMGDNGDAVIVWEQSDGFNTQIFKSEYRNGAWTHPTSQTDNISPDNENATSVKVVMNAHGDTIITWTQSDGGLPQVFKSEYRNGVWHHPSSLSDNISINTQIASGPAAAISDHGSALIVWQQFTGVGVHLFKSEYRNGVWHHPASLDDHFTPDGGNAYHSQVAMSSNGNAVISWTQFDGVATQIFKSEYRNGTWVHPLNLADNISPDGFDANYSRVAMNNNSIVIAWVGSDGSNKQVFKSEYRNGAWTHPSSQTNNISADGQDVSDIPMANNISLDMDNFGRTVIAWAQSDGANFQIFKSIYKNDVWTHPSSLSDNDSVDGYDVIDVSVAASETAGAVMAWSQFDGTNSRIFKSEYR
ncbi:MAG: hypothetical protein R2877_08070 [Bdellovibrionota bacterium]